MIDKKFFDANKHENIPGALKEERHGRRGCRPLGPRPGMTDESRICPPCMEDGPFPPKHFPHHSEPDSLMGQWMRAHRALERMPADHRGVKRVLRLLDLGGGSMTQHELMQLMDVRPGSLSELLGKMEARGLIARERGESDHRRVTICLTDAGQEKAKERGRRDLFAALDDAEKEQLKTLLAKLTASWEDRPEKDAVTAEDKLPEEDREAKDKSEN